MLRIVGAAVHQQCSRCTSARMRLLLAGLEVVLSARDERQFDQIALITKPGRESPCVHANHLRMHMRIHCYDARITYQKLFRMISGFYVRCVRRKVNASNER